MIVHVLRRAQAADIGPVVVATDSPEVAAAVDKAGGRAVMTRARSRLRLRPHLRGARQARFGAARRNRRQRARRFADHRACGDPRRAFAACRRRRRYRDAWRPRSKCLPSGSIPMSSKWWGRRLRQAGCARFISRARPRPAGEGPLYHHIGLYAFRRAALERFVKLPPSLLGAPRKARTVAGAGGRHAHRRRDRRCRAARRRYARGFGKSARHANGTLGSEIAND